MYIHSSFENTRDCFAASRSQGRGEGAKGGEGGAGKSPCPAQVSLLAAPSHTTRFKLWRTALVLQHLLNPIAPCCMPPTPRRRVPHTPKSKGAWSLPALACVPMHAPTCLNLLMRAHSLSRCPTAPSRGLSDATPSWRAGRPSRFSGFARSGL